ncbi:ISAs1 family transposase [Acetatifactor muris]|nr:ISAs1 family transposase [Acetatifactor muris]
MELRNGVPSHDTIQRAMGMIRPENLQQLQRKWQEMLESNEREKLKKIICVDGKTMRSNKREGARPCHIVSAWSREEGYCLGQKAVEEKSNEITAIPKVLESIEIKGQVVTIDAIGTQTGIVETIRKRKADYVLAVKGNQGNLETDIREYFEEAQKCAELKKGKGYKKTTEKAHGQIEIREYYQTEDIGWMYRKKEWKGLKSIGMEKKTIRKGETKKEEHGYYISSLMEDIELFSRAVRGHWAVESMHWHLDVTFKEDANTTLDKTAAQNQNIIRKWCLSMLKLLEIRGTKMSLRRKRFNISFAPAQFIEELLKI